MRYHFIGIGGYGMSALAQLLAQAGHTVTGSDVTPSERTARLARLGVAISSEHRAENVDGADVVVYSTDVPADNPELVAARARGLAVRHRSEILADILNARRGIAVTGSHGKTTVTSMIAYVLERAGLAPTAVIGADVPFYGSNAKLGTGPFVVAEADESDGSLVRYRPEIAVLTNVEAEHLDRYGGDFERLVAAVRAFLGNVKEGGLAVLGSDDPRVRQLAATVSVPVVLYGLGPEAELTARDLVAGPQENSFTVVRAGEELGRVSLQIPGVHNVVNSLAVVAVGAHLGVPFPVIASALQEFRGAKRRFQVIGHLDGITIVDDYAHHPTEIRATLRAARERASNRVIAVFQPQRYTRTYLLMREFGESFSDADEIILTEIYSPPGEKPIPGVSSQVLAEEIRRRERREVSCLSRQEEIVEYLMRIARPGDMVLTMGAGDIWKVARTLAERLQGSRAS